MMDAKAYWEPYQAFKMERFAKTVNPNLGGGGGGGEFYPPSWFSINNWKTVKAVTREFCSIH